MCTLGTQPRLQRVRDESMEAFNTVFIKSSSLLGGRRDSLLAVNNLIILIICEYICSDVF